jgi:hypothetical protein
MFVFFCSPRSTHRPASFALAIKAEIAVCVGGAENARRIDGWDNRSEPTQRDHARYNIFYGSAAIE